MEPMTIFAIAACLLSAGIVYVVLHVRQFGENQAAADKLLKAQTETAQVNKRLQGYTAYADHLEASKRLLADLLKPPLSKVTREYVHVEQVAKEKYKLKADATVVIKYSVEFGFGIDLNTAGPELIDAANGVGLKIARPTLVGEPAVKTLSHQVISAAELPDAKVVLSDVHATFAVLARRYGTAISAEEGVRAVCRLKALEGLRDILAKQPNVLHVPAVFVDFK